jgi:hypothetical protein
VTVVVPAVTPTKVPKKKSIVAMVVFPLVQFPLPLASLNVPDVPGHILVTPVIADGNGFTVNGAVVVHPVVGTV